MVLEFKNDNNQWLLFEKGRKEISLFMKVRVVGTRGLEGSGRVQTVIWKCGVQRIKIYWAAIQYPLKSGDKVKFTRE